MTASTALARIDALCRPPDASSPRPSSSAAPRSSSTATSASTAVFTTAARTLARAPFGHLGIGPVAVLGHHQPEHGVAQELEALVGRDAPGLRAPRSVRQRLDEQAGVAELPAETASRGPSGPAPGERDVRTRRRAAAGAASEGPGPGSAAGARVPRPGAAQTGGVVARLRPFPIWRPRSRRRRGRCGGPRGPRPRCGSRRCAPRAPPRAPSTSSIRASESASRSSANDEDSLIEPGLDLQDVGQLVPDQLEHLAASERDPSPRGSLRARRLPGSEFRPSSYLVERHRSR